MQRDLTILHLGTSASLRAEAAELMRMAEEDVRHPATARQLRLLACKCLALAADIENRREPSEDKIGLAGATIAHLARSGDRRREHDA